MERSAIGVRRLLRRDRNAFLSVAGSDEKQRCRLSAAAFLIFVYFEIAMKED